jgi:hypothetical protein
MPSWKKVVISGSSPTFNNVTTSGNVSGSSTSIATFGSYGGNVSGSSISTGSFGIVLGDGSALTGISTAGSIFAQTGSYYSAYSDLQVTGSLSVLGNISGSFSGLKVGQKYLHTQSSANTTWTISHNFDYQYVNVDVYDGNDQIVIPTSITATDSNTVTLTFGSAVSGNAIVSTGGQAIDERGKNFIHTQSTPSVNWRVTHSIGDQYPSVTVYDSDDNVIIPEQISATDGSKMDITFTEAVSGNANVSVGGGVPSGTVSGSAQTTANLPTGTVSGSAQIASDISGSFTAASSSFSTRVTTEESNVDALQTDSGSFSTRVTTEEANVDTLQSTMTSEQTNIDNLQTDSGSFSTRVTTVEGSGTIQGVGTTDSPTFADLTATGTVTAQEFHTEFVSSSIMYTSGSTRFGNTSDDIHQFTGSIHLTNSGSVSGSSDSTGSFGRVEGTVDFGDIVIDDDEIPIAKLVSDAVTVTAGDGLKTGGSVTLGSSVTLDVDVSDFAGTGLTDEGSENLAVDFSDSTLQTTISGSFTAASSSLASRITSDSGSFSTRITTAESELGNTLISGSAQIANDISGSFLAVSSSLATRVTTEEANVDTLQSTMTSEQTNIDNLQTDSGSFSTRVTKNEATGSSLTTASSSFSTRVTTNEGKATKGFTIAMSVAL